MSGYTVIDSGILQSSLFTLAYATRLAWIAIIVEQRKGIIRGLTPASLSRLAAITIDEAAAAMLCFLSPDPYSRNQTEGGRRLVQVDEGSTDYRLVNGEHYDTMIRRAKDAARQRDHRRTSADERVTERDGGVTECDIPQNVTPCRNLTDNRLPIDSTSDRDIEKELGADQEEAAPPSPSATAEKKKVSDHQRRVGLIVDTLAEAQIKIPPSRAAKWLKEYDEKRIRALLAKVKRGFYEGKSASYLHTILESNDPIDAPPPRRPAAAAPASVPSMRFDEEGS